MGNKKFASTEVTDEMLYFTEEGGVDAGVHARSADGGSYVTIFESPIYHDEVTGLTLNPDATHMYAAYQVNGLLFDIFREDGQPFNAKHLSIQYHNMPDDPQD